MDSAEGHRLRESIPPQPSSLDTAVRIGSTLLCHPAQTHAAGSEGRTHLPPALLRGDVFLAVYPHLQHPRGLREVDQPERGPSLSLAFCVLDLTLS